MAAVMITYSNSLDGPFVFDDRGTILDNQTIESLTDSAVLAAPFETPVAGRPLVNLSFALNYALGGRDVTGYHVGNIAIHLACVLVLFGLVRRATGDPEHTEYTAVGFAVALLWGVHPLNSEAVNYITQRTESLMALCLLLTMYCSVRALDGRKRLRWELLAVGACVAGMASKETMVVAPLLVVLYDRLVRFESWSAAWRERRRLYLGLAATWVVLAGLVMTAPRSLSAGFTAHDADVWTYLLNQTVMITHYLGLAVWPQALAVYYGWPRALTIADVWPQALLVTGLLAATGVACVRWPRAGFIALCAWLVLAPTSSILPIATEVGAERRMYLPLAALLLLAVAGWRHVSVRRQLAPGQLAWGRLAPGLGIGLLIVATVGLSAGTIARNRDYASTLQLAETTLAHWPSPAAHSMLGTELASLGRFAEAETHLRQAASVYPPAQYYLATVLDRLEQTSEAIMYYRAFVASQPGTLDQVRIARSLLADIYMGRQQWAEAIDQYRAMLAGAPDDINVHASLGNALVRQQAFDEAIRHYEQYLAAVPDDDRAISGLAIALSGVGRTDDSLRAFRQVVALMPQDSKARQNLARALANAGTLEEALVEATEALRLAPDDPAAIDLYESLKR